MKICVFRADFSGSRAGKTALFLIGSTRNEALFDLDAPIELKLKKSGQDGFSEGYDKNDGLSPHSDFVLPVSLSALLLLIGFMLPDSPNMIFDQITADAAAQGFVLVDDDSLFRTFFDHVINSGFQRTDPSQGAVEILLQVFAKPLEIVKADMKIGEFSSFDSAISAESASSLAGCFRFSAQKQDAHINNLRLVYKYFKSCRNCCSHGNHQFTNIAETNYEAIKSLTNASCGLKEFPKIVMTKQGDPLVLILRGVVGFYDVLNRIINHYDLVAAEKTGIENELIKRWGTAPNVKKFLSENRRNIYIRNYMNSIHMCPPYVAKTTDVYNFLVAKHAI